MIPPEPTYAVIINGTRWTVWKSISVSRSIERMGGSFSVDLASAPDRGFLSSALHTNLPVQVEIDGAVVLDGFLDTVNHSYTERSADIMVGGRDRTGDLIDCAATVDGPFEFNNQKLEKVIEAVLKPYGIPLFVDVDTGAAFRRLAIQPGETAFAFIDRICRYRAVLAVSNGIGGLVLVKPSSERSPGQLVYGQNIKRGSVTQDSKGRFSLYVLKGQSEGYDETTGEEVSAGEGRAKDDLVPRYRPTVITAESQADNQSLQGRAEHQRNTARARGNTATYEVKGWYADPQNRTLWKPNTVVKVVDPWRAMNRDMLIVSQTFSRSESGTATTLELAPPEAYELLAEVEPQEDGDDYDAMGES